MWNTQVLLNQVQDVFQQYHVKIGLSAYDSKTQQFVDYNASQPFAMASTCKVPIAIHCLQQVELGMIDLNKMYEFTLQDLSPGGGVIPLLDLQGVRLSFRNLIHLMMQYSDNTATDLLVRLSGGYEAINKTLEKWQINGIRLDRDTTTLIQDQMNVQGSKTITTLEEYNEWNDFLEQPAGDENNKRFLADERDTTTPRAMAEILKSLKEGRFLSPDFTAMLLEIMQRCQTGKERIAGLLPDSIKVASKTGSIGPVTNDVGVISLPDRQEYLVLAVYVQSFDLDNKSRENMIAQVSKKIFDAVTA